MSIRIDGAGANFGMKPDNKPGVTSVQNEEAILNLSEKSSGYEIEKTQAESPKNIEPRLDKAVNTTAKALDEKENAQVFEIRQSIKELMMKGDISFTEKQKLYSYFAQIRDIRIGNLDDKRLNNSEREITDALTARFVDYDKSDAESVQTHKENVKQEYEALTPKEKDTYKKVLDRPLRYHNSENVPPEMIKYAVKYANGDYSFSENDELDNFIDTQVYSLVEQSLLENQPEIDNDFKAIIDEKVRMIDFKAKSDALTHSRNEMYRKAAAAQRRERSAGALKDYEVVMGRKATERMKKISESSDSVEAAKRFKEKGYW